MQHVNSMGISLMMRVHQRNGDFVHRFTHHRRTAGARHVQQVTVAHCKHALFDPNNMHA
jgi:hypothetical protein